MKVRGAALRMGEGRMSSMASQPLNQAFGSFSLGGPRRLGEIRVARPARGLYARFDQSDREAANHDSPQIRDRTSG
jgi:hypothetical protein